MNTSYPEPKRAPTAAAPLNYGTMCASGQGMPYSWSTMPSTGTGQQQVLLPREKLVVQKVLDRQGIPDQGGGRGHIPRPTGRASALQHWSTSWWQCSVNDSSWALSQDTPRNLASCSTMVTRSWKTGADSRAAHQRQHPGSRVELETALVASFFRTQAISSVISQEVMLTGALASKPASLGFEPMALGRVGRCGDTSKRSRELWLVYKQQPQRTSISGKIPLSPSFWDPCTHKCSTHLTYWKVD